MPILAKYMLIGYLYYVNIAAILIVFTPIIYKALRIDVKGDLFRKVSEVE